MNQNIQLLSNQINQLNNTKSILDDAKQRIDQMIEEIRWKKK